MGIQIPDYDKKYIFLYSPDHPNGKLVLRYDERGAPNKHEDRLKAEREGWSENRFAVMLYHKDFEPTICRRPEEVEALKAEGWTLTMPTDQHPHAKDPARLKFLALQKAKGQPAQRGAA